MVEQITAGGGRAHQVWLPPLEAPEPLDVLMVGLAEHPGRGLGAPGPELCVPIGTVDLPFQQRREPFVVDVSAAGGHIGIVGRPRSGKSTALRTLVAALALRHTPAEVQFYCLDFSGALLAMADLPHVGGVAGRQEPEVVQRLVAEVATILEDRERRFRELGVDSMATYRRMRADGRVTDDPFGDVFLVVDGWGVLRGEFEELEATIIALAARSLTYGVHVVLATNRWMDLRLGMRDIIGTKTELRIGDAIDSEIDRKLAAAVPDRPGRGIGPHRAHHLVGVPRIDGRHSTERAARRPRGPGGPRRARLDRPARAAGPAAAPPGGARPAAVPATTRRPGRRSGRQPAAHRGPGPARRSRACCSSATRRAARPRRCARSPARSSRPTATGRRSW